MYGNLVTNYTAGLANMLSVQSYFLLEDRYFKSTTCISFKSSFKSFIKLTGFPGSTVDILSLPIKMKLLHKLETVHHFVSEQMYKSSRGSNDFPHSKYLSKVDLTKFLLYKLTMVLSPHLRVILL